METRSRSKVKGKTSPPRAATAGGTQPVRDVFVDPPSSAAGLSGDGRISPRSSSLETGPRRTCRLTASSESASGTRGPAQEAKNDENRVVVGSTSIVKRSSSTPQTKAGILQVIYFKFHENRSRGLRSVEGRKSPSPIDLAHGLYNSLYYRTSRDKFWK